MCAYSMRVATLRLLSSGYPYSIRAKISQTLYLPYIEKVSLFKGCSSEFINQIVIRLHEFFLPGEVVMEQGNVVDQLYFVCHGVLEEVGTAEDGSEETVSLLQPNSSFGEISILCNIPQPYTLKGLIRAGADPNKTDYDGRSPLHLAASRGYEDITLFLIQEGVDVNIKAVARGDSDYLKRLLSNGMDPNLKDYDFRSPLHIAAAEGLYFMAKLLLEAGSSVFTKDRWGNTPLDEARMCGNKNLIKLLEEAKSAQLSEFPYPSQEFTDKMHQRSARCSLSTRGIRKIIEDMELYYGSTLHRRANQNSGRANRISGDSCILSEDAGKITDVDMIKDGQKLYLVHETH
ncbi:Potassium channel SKOR [Spatholobus suberectus]|nr:Potassium channel SKOR [Spatholobus suberectus]